MFLVVFVLLFFEGCLPAKVSQADLDSAVDMDALEIDQMQADETSPDVTGPDHGVDTRMEPVCGNDICEQGEGGMDPACPMDCPFCGDGVCGEGESSTTIIDDKEVYLFSCLADCADFFACGNKVCEPGQTPESCPEDCLNSACGDGACDPTENAETCPHDCAIACGNGDCETGESFEDCPADCGYCGDGICQNMEKYPSDDDVQGVSKYCKADCNMDCGDGTCDAGEEATCPADCLEFFCDPTPACQAKECGYDGCGGFCPCGDGAGDCTATGVCATKLLTVDNLATAFPMGTSDDEGSGDDCQTFLDHFGEAFCKTDYFGIEEYWAQQERPQHNVVFSAPFMIERHEVTVALFVAFLKRIEAVDGANGEDVLLRCDYNSNQENIPAGLSPLQVECDGLDYTTKEICQAQPVGAFDQSCAEHPIVGVTWEGARQYCANLGRFLCTEAQWERAAKAAQEHRIWPWGSTFDGDIVTGKANGSALSSDDGFDRTAPIMSFPDGVSASGAFDLAGNVWEWTQDLYCPYTYALLAPGTTSDPTGPNEGDTCIDHLEVAPTFELNRRTIRGGGYAAHPNEAIGWDRGGFDLRCSLRKSLAPELGDQTSTWGLDVGFRCCAPAPL